MNSGWAPFSCPCLHLAQEPEEWGDFWFSQDLWKIKPTLEIICCVWAAPGSVQLRELGLPVGFSCQDLARAHKTPTNWNHERFGCRRNKYCTQLGRNHLQSAQRAPQGAEMWLFCESRNECAVLREGLEHSPDKWLYPPFRREQELSLRMWTPQPVQKQLLTKSSINGDKSLSGRGDKAATGEEFNTQQLWDTDKTQGSGSSCKKALGRRNKYFMTRRKACVMMG